MSLNSLSHRFDPRWLFPAIASDGSYPFPSPNHNTTIYPGRSWVRPLCEAIEPAMLCTRVRSLAAQAHRILSRMPCVHYEDGHELRQQLALLQMEIDRLRRFHSLRFDELQRWLDSLIQRVEGCCPGESA